MAGDALVLGGLVSLHEGEPASAEHARLAVDALAKVLCLDQGMLPAQFLDFAVHECAILGTVFRTSALVYLNSRRMPSCFSACLAASSSLARSVLLVHSVPTMTLVAFVDGDHGCKVFVILGRGDVLGFVDDQQERGDGANNVGVLVSGEIRDCAGVDHAA